jgi:arylsulfatase A-like enzyme
MAKDDRPNILFLMTDHQRFDSLHMVQAGLQVTPNLSRLASSSTRFTRAYNTCPLCVPARTALATGQYPTRNGVVFNDWHGTRAGDHVTLHQSLAEAGYDVGHIGVHHIRVAPPLEDRVPFSKWIGESEYRHYLKKNGIVQDRTSLGHFRNEVIELQDDRYEPAKYSNTKTDVWPHEVEHFRDLFFCREAAEYIRHYRNRPFALFLYLWAPHPPLRVPEPYASLFEPGKLALPPNVGQAAEAEPSGRRKGAAAQLGAGVSMSQWRRAWAAHLGLVRLADEGLGRVVEALEDSGKADNTLVLFTVDHGDHLGQHAMYQKMEMYEQAIRIPLLIRGPGVRPQEIDTCVSHLDVMPTLLDLAGLTPPDQLDGRSLRDCLLHGEVPEERPVFCQYSGNPTIGDLRRAVVTNQLKYVYDPRDTPELYDLHRDPYEMVNLAADVSYRDRMEELHEACRTWGEDHNDWVEF